MIYKIRCSDCRSTTDKIVYKVRADNHSRLGAKITRYIISAWCLFQEHNYKMDNMVITLNPILFITITVGGNTSLPNEL